VVWWRDLHVQMSTRVKLCIRHARVPSVLVCDRKLDAIGRNLWARRHLQYHYHLGLHVRRRPAPRSRCSFRSSKIFMPLLSTKSRPYHRHPSHHHLPLRPLLQRTAMVSTLKRSWHQSPFPPLLYSNTDWRCSCH